MLSGPYMSQFCQRDLKAHRERAILSHTCLACEQVCVSLPTKQGQHREPERCGALPAMAPQNAHGHG